MYTINLHKITVLGEDLGVVFRHYNDVIVDSGTTVLYGPYDIINAIEKKIFKFCDQDHKHCDGN